MYTTSLIGRSREVAEVIGLLDDPAIKLVTLIGVSGTGKTRLSLAVTTALRLTGQHVVFIPLAAISHHAFVLPAIAQHFDIRERGSTRLIDQLIRYLHGRQLVIVLDNVEQVVEAAPEIDALVESVPGLKIIVTSQVALTIPSETLYFIPGLELPKTMPTTPKSALRYGAIQLFVQRIKVAQPTFYFSKHMIVPVVNICRLLAGLPLAIEIVAAHSGVLLPSDMEPLVQQHLMLYRFRGHQASDRQRIILPMIEWSLLRLPQDAQALFNHVGVFRGGWCIDALAAVLQQSQDDIDIALESLLERHLVLEQTTADQLTRYMLLDAVQDYADRRFNARPWQERIDSIKQHTTFLQDLTAQAQTQLLNGHNQQQWMLRLTQEMPNLRFVLEWAIEQAPQQALSLAKNMGRFWQQAGYWNEGLNWYDQILEQIIPQAADLATISANRAILLRSLGRFSEATAEAHKGISIGASLDEPVLVGRLYNTLGLLHLDQQDYAIAQEYFTQALTIAQAAKDDTLHSIALGNLANVNLNLGDYDGSLVQYQQTYLLAKKSGQYIAEIVALCNIGCIYTYKHQPAAALEPFDDVLAVAKAIQYKDLYASVLYFKARALLMLEQPGAIMLLKESIHILHGLSSMLHICQALDIAATVFEKNGDLETAGMVVGAVDRIREAVHIPRSYYREELLFDDMLKRVQEQPVFAQAREVGRLLSREQVIELVLSGLPNDEGFSKG